MVSATPFPWAVNSVLAQALPESQAVDPWAAEPCSAPFCLLISQRSAGGLRYLFESVAWFLTVFIWLVLIFCFSFSNGFIGQNQVFPLFTEKKRVIVFLPTHSQY